jgi:peptidyl-prolyl cis-trans isomerase B (cyclophilin B)
VVDANKNYTATISTDKGDIVLKLLVKDAPRTVNTFVFLVQQGYYDGITFHRVVKNFVVQGGGPTGLGSGGPGFETEEDQNGLSNTRGMVSMAKVGSATNFGSQFFVNLKDNVALDKDGTASKRFYPFGEVTSGMDVVEQLAAGDAIDSITITVK